MCGAETLLLDWHLRPKLPACGLLLQPPRDGAGLLGAQAHSQVGAKGVRTAGAHRLPLARLLLLLQEIEEFCKTASGGASEADPFEGLSPEEIDAYVEKQGRAAAAGQA